MPLLALFFVLMLPTTVWSQEPPLPLKIGSVLVTDGFGGPCSARQTAWIAPGPFSFAKGTEMIGLHIHSANPQNQVRDIEPAQRLVVDKIPEEIKRDGKKNFQILVYDEHDNRFFIQASRRSVDGQVEEVSWELFRQLVVQTFEIHDDYWAAINSFLT